MAASQYCHATAFLHRIGLLCGILAITAGIFGMHVITGTHAMHAPAAVVASADAAVHPEPPASDGHEGHEAGGTSAAHQASGVQDRIVAAGQSCSCSGNCTACRPWPLQARQPHP